MEPDATLPLGFGPFGAGFADGLADDGGGPLGGLEPHAVDLVGSLVGGAGLRGGGVVPVLRLEGSFGPAGGVLTGGDGVLPG